MAKISVVIPAYNGASYLAETIDSVRNQTHQDWELIIVDDGSTDGTRALAQKYAVHDPRIRVVAQTNRGQAAARNRGKAEISCDSDYVIFLDHDDVWETTTLATLLDALEAYPGAVAAHGLTNVIDGKGTTIGRQEQDSTPRRTIIGRRAVKTPAHAPTTFNTLVIRNCIWTTGAILIRRDALERAGDFDVVSGLADDWNMWLRLSAIGEIAFTDTYVVRWRRHTRAQSENHGNMHNSTMQVYQYLFSSASLTEEQRRAARMGFWWRKWGSFRYRWHWIKESVARGQWQDAARHGRRMLGWGTRLVGKPRSHPNQVERGGDG